LDIIEIKMLSRVSSKLAQVATPRVALNKTPKKFFHNSPTVFGDKKAQYKVTNSVEFPVADFAKYKTEGDESAKKAFAYFVVGTASMGYATAAKAGVVSALGSLSASADVLALANVEVELGNIPEGTTTTVKWRGKPLFIRHRTAEEIEAARATALSELPDPAKDEDRAKREEWLVVLGICTHLGCVPLANAGEYNGWFCPCHGSHYDTSGRIRKGPAPLNLEVPPYTFVADDKIVVGQE
jgi:ubiquinol-cytochrome c reductase iron-sulfur subunit